MLSGAVKDAATPVEAEAPRGAAPIMAVSGGPRRGARADAVARVPLTRSGLLVLRASLIGTFPARLRARHTKSRGNLGERPLSSKLALHFPALFLLCFSLTGCSVIKGRRMGGILSAVIILGLMDFGINRLRR